MRYRAFIWNVIQYYFVCAERVCERFADCAAELKKKKKTTDVMCNHFRNAIQRNIIFRPLCPANERQKLFHGPIELSRGYFPDRLSPLSLSRTRFYFVHNTILLFSTSNNIVVEKYIYNIYIYDRAMITGFVCACAHG